MEVHNIISFGARVNLWICILITAMFGVFFIFIGLKGFMVQKPYVVSIRSLMAFQIAYTGMGILACLESVFLKLFYLPMHDIFLSVLAIPALIGAIAILWKYSSGYFVVGLPLYVLEEMVHLDNIKLKDDGNGLIKIDAVGKTEKELSNLVRVMREQFVNYGGCVYLSASKLYLVGGIVLLLFVVGLVGVSFMNEGLNFLW